MTDIIQELAEHACHFGHKTSRWNPRMAPYLWGKRGGVHIFDLEQTAAGLEEVSGKIQDLTSKGCTILFVSTKPQTKAVMSEIHEKTNHPVIRNKWVGGLLTNFDTVKTRIKYLKELRELFESGDIAKYPKREASQMKKEMEKLEVMFGGIADMYRVPDAVFIVDGQRDEIAIREANKLGIPVYGIADSNVDPDGYAALIPANDDAITSLSYILGRIFSSVTPRQA